MSPRIHASARLCKAFTLFLCPCVNVRAAQAWKELEAEARSGSGVVVRGFNTRLMGLVDSCLKGCALAHAHTHVHTCAHTHVCKHMHMHTHMHAHAHTFTHTRSHTPAWP